MILCCYFFNYFCNQIFIKKNTMGLFSFNKDAGQKNTGATDEAKGKFLTDIVNRYDFGVENMKINVTGDKASISGVADSLMTKEKVILAAGNIKGIAEIEDLMTIGDSDSGEAVQGEVKVVGGSKFYTVKKGDSLSKISKAMYGNPMKYNSIFEANKPMLKNVDLIYPGQVLRIPELN